MKIFFLLIFLFSTCLCFSQAKKAPDVFKEGYIITLKLDTIKGQIKMPKAGSIELYQKVIIKDKTNKIRLYTPEKINGYWLEDYFYMSAYRDNRPCFFKVLSSGKLTLLFIQFNSSEFSGLHDEFCVVTEGKDQDLKILDEKGLKKQLKDLFKSNKEFVQKINNQKEISLNTETLEIYFKEYNQAAN